MSRNLNLLEKYLKRKRKYSIKELKEALHIISDEDLLTQIVLILQRELETFNLNRDNSCHSFLFRCFEYLNWHESKLTLEKANFYKEISLKLLELNVIIDDLINKKIEISHQSIYDENINQLIKLGIKIDNFIEEHYKEESQENNKVIYSLMRHLLFEVKSYELIKEITKEMPNIKRIKNGDNISILEELIDKYITLTKKDNGLEEDLRTIIYYEKIINLFSKSYHDKNAIEIIKTKLEKEYYKIKSNGKISDIDKRRVLFHLHEVINNVAENKKTSEDALVYKYNIDDSKINCDEQDLKKICYKDYEDLTKINVFTIDDASAKCMEDAISFNILQDGNYEVNIYITDVDSRINEGSKLDLELEKRALTVNIKKQELFSRKIAISKFSLLKDKNSLVIAHKFVFNKYGEIISFKIGKAIINVKNNFTYDTYKEYLKNNENFQELSKLFCVINYNNETRKISVNDFDKLKLDISSQTLVSGYSIFLNEYMSKYCAFRKIPFIFRSDQNINIKLEEDVLKEKSTQKIIGVIQNTTLPISSSSENKGIKVLRKGSYGCVTNPVREYDALINQRMIKKFLISNFKYNYSDFVKNHHYISYLCHFLEEKAILEGYLKEEINKQKQLNR